jgi:hypothetical protein
MISKEEAKYRPWPKITQKCDTCSMFRRKDKACTLVRGEISEYGWCEHWEPKK